MSTAAPLIEANTLFDLPDSLVTSDATELLLTPLVPCTMTWKTWLGFACACASKDAGTNALPCELAGVVTPGSAGPPEPATPAAGTASALTMASNAVKPPSLPRTRPPLPQSAFPRAPQGPELNLMMVGTPFRARQGHV